VALWRPLARGLRTLLRRDAADRDVADELQHYLDESIRAHLARGLPPDAARRAARVELGSAAAAHEQVRASGWEHVPLAVAGDLRDAARRLRRAPGFTIVASLTLALGIGSSTAIFSAVNPILFEPLPYPHADRLVLLTDSGANGAPVDVTYGTYVELAARSRAFADLAVADRWQPALMDQAEPERLRGDRVTAGYFRTLGVAPAAGRDFDPADDRPDAPRVAMVSDGLVRRRFGRDDAVLGRQITLDGDAYTVIGILPPGFDNVLSPAADVWAPRRYRAHASFESAGWGHHLRMVGRLAPGVTVDEARREVAAIGASPVAAYPRPPWASMKSGLDINSLQAAVTRGVRPALIAIVAAVALLFAIAGVNVTSLLLARGARRRGELAVRAALGAGRARLVGQLLTESLLLALVGGALGLGVAASGVRALVALAPAGLPRASAIHLDPSACLFAFVLTTLVGLGVGLAPALQGTREGLRAGVRSGARTTRAQGALRRVLVAAELALALVLLVGAGLMLRSLTRLFATAPGFDAAHVLTMQVEAAGHGYDSDAARYQFFRQALEAVRRVPGVTGAALTSQLPLSGDLDGYGVMLESVSRREPNDFPNALRYAVTPGWFRTMRIPLRRGRLLDDRDRPGTAEAVVISESFAAHQFPGRNPIGQRLRAGPETGDPGHPWDVVVGVVGDVKQTSLALGADDAFYVPMGQWAWVDDVQSLVARTSGDAAALAPAVERAIWSVDRDQPIVRVATMDELVARSEAERRFVLTIFEAFGLTALALAAIGVFGMMSGSVAERMRELGVRSALGASRGRLLAMVMGQGAVLTVAGAAVGLAAAALGSRALASLLFGVSRLDAPTYLGVAALLLLVSAAACGVPAWRASRVDPVRTLRAE
jgi:putative ABC transport system permease protein